MINTDKDKLVFTILEETGYIPLSVIEVNVWFIDYILQTRLSIRIKDLAKEV